MEIGVLGGVQICHGPQSQRDSGLLTYQSLHRPPHHLPQFPWRGGLESPKKGTCSYKYPRPSYHSAQLEASTLLPRILSQQHLEDNGHCASQGPRAGIPGGEVGVPTLRSCISARNAAQVRWLHLQPVRRGFLGEDTAHCWVGCRAVLGEQGAQVPPNLPPPASRPAHNAPLKGLIGKIQ